MMWVNETLPPRARDRWLLITIRLSQSSLTGTERTEVAVGTDNESSMFATVRAGAPRSTVYVGWSEAGGGAGSFFSFGTGRSVPLAGSAALVSGRGLACGCGRPSAGALGLLVGEGESEVRGEGYQFRIGALKAGPHRWRVCPREDAHDAQGQPLVTGQSACTEGSFTPLAEPPTE